MPIQRVIHVKRQESCQMIGMQQGGGTANLAETANLLQAQVCGEPSERHPGTGRAVYSWHAHKRPNFTRQYKNDPAPGYACPTKVALLQMQMQSQL
jgi:hypothetical protein